MKNLIGDFRLSSASEPSRLQLSQQRADAEAERLSTLEAKRKYDLHQVRNDRRVLRSQRRLETANRSQY